MMKDYFKGKTKRNSFDGNFSQVLNNFGLKSFGGKKDNDGDGVLNKFDCQPNNIMRQDKVLWPRNLKKKNINFKNVSPRRQRIIQKQFRRNPELLSRKLDSSRVDITVNDTLKDEGAYAYVTAVNPEGEKITKKDTHAKKDHYHLALGKQMFEQRYDPKFEEFMSDEQGNLPDKQTMYEEALKHKKKYKNTAFTNMPRTLSHEMQHVKQVDIDNDGRYDKFQDKYAADQEYYEEDADKYAADQLLRRKDRSLKDDDVGYAFEWFEDGAGASQKKQDEWAEMSSQERNRERQNLQDTDGDRVPDKYDCDPDNVMRQDSYHARQSLWHAGNKPPSATLRDEGRVFGFSSPQYAEGWKEKHGKKNIYRFTTDNYVLDDKSYSRPLAGNKSTLSDNEFIAVNVHSEQEFDGYTPEELSLVGER